ncbi:MAG: thioredoxin [Brooklawnia sp.]|uniref:thioredoxin n=1 Tax=Brooklawnia sp. TaxID=2699740 RepID=UPI003C74291C
MSSQVITCRHCGTRNRVPASASGRPTCPKCSNPLPWIAAADDENFEQVADSQKIAVLVDLWAPWCGPCRQVTPVLEQIANDQAGRVKLVKVNVDNSPLVASRFGARSIPTMVLLRNGRVIARQIGALPAARLKRWVADSLNSPATN